ncbi:cytochrome P450 [Hypoxylon trugodes]|uniref:cytochrome P450 n=1 Tax=Hypoxylon trugodes TaxID=326681 RepID=UPI00219DC957|nr:cytochrome P450 [Hypoxylon trugodes]KAI1382926.1 cytochrome P450 [Hypoxylon trugodes]
MTPYTEPDSLYFYSSLVIPRDSLYIILFLILIFVIYVLGSEVNRYLARVPGLPGPRGLPLMGSLPWLWGKVHAEQYRSWAAQYGDVFQVQLGNRTVVIVNSAASARALFLGQREATNSRPLFYVLHQKVQSGSVTSIGTSPWDESCRRRRKVAATALNKVAVDSYFPILNLESRAFLADILDASLSANNNTVDFRDAVRKFAMNLVLTLNYGTRVESLKDLRSNAMIAEIIHVETEITRLRDTTRNYENYIPLLRPLNRLAEWTRLRDGNYMPNIGKRRTGYHQMLLEKLKEQVTAGIDQPCIQGNVLKDPESKGLTDNEILSVSLSMMAGADTSQPTLAWTILLLSQRPDVQRKAYQSIIDADPTLLTAPDVAHTRVEYIDAFTKEISRYYTALKLGLPRATYDEVHWKGATIPPKTMMFVNSWACSRDEGLFEDPNTFAPERWLHGGTHYHQFAFGIGGRMCVANHLAHKALYTVFLHLIAHFEILPTEGLHDPLIDDPLEGVSEKEQFVSAPRGRTARLVPRDIMATRKVLGLI